PSARSHHASSGGPSGGSIRVSHRAVAGSATRLGSLTHGPALLSCAPGGSAAVSGSAVGEWAVDAERACTVAAARRGRLSRFMFAWHQPSQATRLDDVHPQSSTLTNKVHRLAGVAAIHSSPSASSARHSSQVQNL